MFCQACGKEMDDAAQFCPGCGRPMHAPSPSKAVAALQSLAVHLRIMSILWVIYGVFQIVTAFLTVGMPGNYFAMFQKMVGANSGLSSDVLHAIFVWSGIFAMFAGALGLFAGWMLMRRERSGRMIALIASFVALIQVPIGTGLAIYTFVELLPAAARERYAQLLATSR
ncbi:MAG: zinc-ribbon domain-containing protein [Candidatus Acidiferrales bacterium]